MRRSLPVLVKRGESCCICLYTAFPRSLPRTRGGFYTNGTWCPFRESHITELRFREKKIRENHQSERESWRRCTIMKGKQVRDILAKGHKNEKKNWRTREIAEQQTPRCHSTIQRTGPLRSIYSESTSNSESNGVRQIISILKETLFENFEGSRRVRRDPKMFAFEIQPN